MRYGSGSQWFAIARELAAAVARNINMSSSTIGAIYRDLTAVKQPDESFFQAVVLNTRFCSRYSDYTLHWTDKDSMREVRSSTSEYNILSPGVLGNLKDSFKIAEVREQSLWAFFARKFDDSRDSVELKDRLDLETSQRERRRWHPLKVPAAGRLVEVLATSSNSVVSTERLDRNKDGLFGIQLLRLQLDATASHGRPRVLQLREKLAMPKTPSRLLALRVGCDWNKTELVFDGDVSLVSTSDTGPFRCPSLWAVAHWRMSKKPMSQELMLIWVDPKGTPMQHAPISVSENSVLLWHRYTATMPLPRGKWSVEVVTASRQVIARRTFFAYRDPGDIPWQQVQEHFDVLPEDSER